MSDDRIALLERLAANCESINIARSRVRTARLAESRARHDPATAADVDAATEVSENLIAEHRRILRRLAALDPAGQAAVQRVVDDAYLRARGAA